MFSSPGPAKDCSTSAASMAIFKSPGISFDSVLLSRNGATWRSNIHQAQDGTYFAPSNSVVSCVYCVEVDSCKLAPFVLLAATIGMVILVSTPE